MKTTEARVGEIREWLGTGSLNFFGKPFAGKDSQAALLNTQWAEEVPILSGGEIIRNSVIPQHVKDSMERGELIETAEYEKIVLPFLSQGAFAELPLLLSSVGRMRGEEAGVLAATKSAGHPLKAVPYIDITETEVYKRLAANSREGRNDDSPESLRVRLEYFREETEPVLATYEDMGLLIPISGMEDKEIVFHALISALHEYALAN